MHRLAALTLLALLGCSGGTTAPSGSVVDASADTTSSVPPDSTAPGPDATVADDTASPADTMSGSDTEPADASVVADTALADTAIADSAIADTKPVDACVTPCGSTCCPATAACLFGTCIDCGTMLACAGTCVDQTSNPEHCGTCGNKCASGLVCVSGTCTTTCPSGRTACSGWCRDTTLDPLNCGTCGNACPARPGGSVACEGSVCTTACYPGYSDCNKVGSDGCEVRLGTHANCSSCGDACASDRACVAGACSPGKYVFVTRGKTNGSLGGVSGADARCQAAAAAASLPGTYLAWLDVPATRFAKSTVPYVLTNGKAVASNWADLTDSTLAESISVDEYGGSVPSTDQVWTDANAKGETFFSAKNCVSWNSGFSSARGSFGHAGAKDETWAGRLSQEFECLGLRHLYCFQQ